MGGLQRHINTKKSYEIEYTGKKSNKNAQNVLKVIYNERH